MATKTITQAEFLYNVDGQTPGVVISFPEAASQSATLKTYWVQLTSGAVTILASGDARILGQLLDDCNGTTGHMVRVRCIRPGDVLRMNLYHSTAASAIPSGGVLATYYDLLVSNTKLTLDVEHTSDAIACPVDYEYRHTNGHASTDVYAVVHVMFKPTALMIGGGGATL